MRWLLPLLLIISVKSYAAETSPVSDAAPGAVTAEANTEAVATATATTEEVAAGKDLPKVDNRKESEIPLNLDGGKKAGADGMGWFRVLLTLSILGVVGAGAYVFLKKYSVPKEKKHQTQIKVLQQHYLGPKKSLAIVRVAGESILIGVTDNNISMIKSLSLLDDEVPEEAPKNFENVMGGMNAAPADFAADDDEFAFGGIKDMVSKRLKGMRSFQ